MQQVESRLLQNKYEIISKIKQGGFGVVYYGFDRVFDKPIAIKAIEPTLLKNEKYINLFLEEAKNAAKLSHNNIVHIYDLVKDKNGHYFIIMEFVEGYDLGRILSQCRKKQLTLPIDFSVYILKEICKALEYAHNKRSPITNQPLKLVHQDISPSNLMISVEGHIKLIDFGLAKLRIQKTKSDEIIISGKIPYLAPEQINGRQIDRRTDIFSLGVVFYEMLCGTRFVDAKETKQALQQILKQRLDTEALRENKIPQPIQEILQKMLQKNPEQRYFGANGVYLDLIEFLMANTHSVELSDELGEYIRELFKKGIKSERVETNLPDAAIQESYSPEVEIYQAEHNQNEAFLNQDTKTAAQTVNEKRSVIWDEKNAGTQRTVVSSIKSAELATGVHQNAELVKIISEIEQNFKEDNDSKIESSTGQSSQIVEKNNKSTFEAASEKLIKEQPSTITNTFPDDDEVQDDLKTVIDVIRLTTRSHQKGFKIVSLTLLVLLIIFFAIDFSQQLTPIGHALYNKIYPPAIKIVTIPAGAAVYLNEKRIVGETPITIPEIVSGVYQLSLTHEGFSPITKSIQVAAKDKIKISGEKESSEQQSFLFRFKSRVGLNSNPTAATIFLNNMQYPQKTPTSFEWEAGLPLSIEMAHAGFNRISGLFLNTGGEEIVIKDEQVWSHDKFDGTVKNYSFEGNFRKSFNLDIIPNDVLWYIDGSSVAAGTTSVSNTLSLCMGEHELLFKKQGFNDKLVTINVNEDAPEFISLIMDRTVHFIARENANADTNEIEVKITRYVFKNKTFIIDKVTPSTVSLPAVDVSVYFEKEGYKDTNIFVSAGQRDVFVTLEVSTVTVEIFVFDVLTDLPLGNTNITYQARTGELAGAQFGTTDEFGKCVSSLKSGEYIIKASKSGYFEKQLDFDTKSPEKKLEFKLIIQ